MKSRWGRPSPATEAAHCGGRAKRVAGRRQPRRGRGVAGVRFGTQLIATETDHGQCLNRDFIGARTSSSRSISDLQLVQSSRHRLACLRHQSLGSGRVLQQQCRPRQSQHHQSQPQRLSRRRPPHLCSLPQQHQLPLFPLVQLHWLAQVHSPPRRHLPLWRARPTHRRTATIPPTHALGPRTRLMV